MLRIFLSPHAYDTLQQRVRKRSNRTLADEQAFLVLRTRRRRALRARSCKNRREQEEAEKRQQERSLQHQLAEMEAQIDALDRQRSLYESVTVYSRQNAANYAVDLISKYHEIIHKGYDPIRFPARAAEIEGFIQSIMVDDVRCFDFTGVTIFLDQWKLHTTFHADLMCKNDGLELLSSDEDGFVVKTHGKTHLRISRKTIERLFPHILQDEPLVQWLIGKEYSFGYTTVIHINKEGRVFQFESQVDLTSALLDLLQDPMITLKMVQSSVMTKAGNFVFTESESVQEGMNNMENRYL